MVTLLARAADQALGRRAKWGKAPAAGRARICCPKEGHPTPVCPLNTVGFLAGKGKGLHSVSWMEGACGLRRSSWALPRWDMPEVPLAHQPPSWAARGPECAGITHRGKHSWVS